MVTSPALSTFFFYHFLSLLWRMTPHLTFSSSPLLALGVTTTFLHLRPLLTTNARPWILHSINPTIIIIINNEQVEMSTTKSIIVCLFSLATIDNLAKRPATFIPQHHIRNLYVSIFRHVRFPRPRLLPVPPAVAFATTDRSRRYLLSALASPRIALASANEEAFVVPTTKPTVARLEQLLAPNGLTQECLILFSLLHYGAHLKIRREVRINRRHSGGFLRW
mmetsp:Transcript_5038/g.7316  ORF Transcript_5038/g.7316 Transcript_5038/m.7316 type:complete len:222 (-) Transcript_5038:378-1043(-)